MTNLEHEAYGKLCGGRTRCIDQWMDGAITFIEMVRFLSSTVTKEEVEEFNQFLEPKAEFPFNG